jgi:phospholipase/lecithinase/hemolysin
MSGAVFAVATLGKIDASNKTNTSQFSYKHAIELITPTANGGNFNTFNFNNDEQIGFFQTNSNNYIFNTTIDQQQNDPKYYSALTKPYYSDDLNERYEHEEISGTVLDSFINGKNDSCF